MRHSCFTVSGKPFFSLGGQVHNSSSYPIGGIGEGKAGRMRKGRSKASGQSGEIR